MKLRIPSKHRRNQDQHQFNSMQYAEHKRAPIPVPRVRILPRNINLNPEVDFWLYGRHLVKSIWRHNPAMDRLIMTKFGRLKQNHMRRTKHRSRSKSEGKFQYGGSPFPEPEVVLFQPWIEISHRNLVRKQIFAFINECNH